MENTKKPKGDCLSTVCSKLGIRPLLQFNLIKLVKECRWGGLLKFEDTESAMLINELKIQPVGYSDKEVS